MSSPSVPLFREKKAAAPALAGVTASECFGQPYSVELLTT